MCLWNTQLVENLIQLFMMVAREWCEIILIPGEMNVDCYNDYNGTYFPSVETT